MHFVLDHNFPWMVTEIPWPPKVRLSTLYDIDAQHLAECDDWELLYALDEQEESVDGLITNDHRMLNQAPEMVALSDTSLVLVALKATGDHPLRATGLVMAHIEKIANAVDGSPRIYLLSNITRATNVDGHINRLAERKGMSPPELIAEARSSIRRA